MKTKSLLAAAALILLSAASFAGGYCGDMSGLKVRAGTVFAITLEANPTTGYSWAVDHVSPEGSIKVMSSSYSPVRPGLTGSGGYETWLLKALIRGRAEISFEYRRPWEKGTPPIETRNITIKVCDEKVKK